MVDKVFGEHKHHNLAQYARFLGPAIADFSIFSAIRHLCDRAMSSYFFQKQACRDHGLRWIRPRAEVPAISFDPAEFGYFLDEHHPGTFTQLSYLTAPGLALPIRLLLGLAPTPELPHLNASARIAWQQVLVGDLLARTKAVFRDDFRHFYGS